MVRNKKILVTGVCGVFGSTLSLYLSDKGFKVEGVDLPNVLPPIDLKGIKIHHLDIMDFDALSSFISNYDCIIHLAAISRVGMAKKTPLKAIHANITSTATLLEAIRVSENKPPMIFASSIEVNVDEQGAYGLSNLYGMTKSVGELLSQRYSADYGMSIAVARIPGIYGTAYDYHDKVPNIFITKALKGEKIRIPSQSKEMLYVHIDDMCQIMMESVEKVLNFQIPSYCVFEIKSRDTTTLKQLVCEILVLTRSKSSLDYFDAESDFPLRLSEIQVSPPHIGLKEGLLRLIKGLKALN